MNFLKLVLVFLISFNVLGNPVQTGHAEVSLVKFGKTNDSDVEKYIGIKMDMQKNWHTYWKNPGDSGGPIKVAWTSNSNVKFSDISWPTPQLIPYDPLMTYGYKDFVIFPVKITYEEDDDPYIEAYIDFLICDDICVPEKAFIQTKLSQINIDENVDLWLKKVPIQTLPVLIDTFKEHIELRFSNNENIKSAVFFPENSNLIKHAAKQILTKEENNWLLKINLQKDIEIPKNINGIIKFNNDSSYLVDQDIEADSFSADSISFLQAIIFAFLGGLILNLMPCVFPIISLKILSFISMSEQSKSKIRNHALVFCAGVLVSFLIIGITLISLKQAGNFLGWGFQLQSPIIVSFLSILMFLIGIILLMDVDIGSSLTRLGSIGSSNLQGSFLTGVLAVIVASPCTAPFMGAALGYALIQPSGETIPIFLSLGTGFAFPYLFLSIFPSLVDRMPRPGSWMVTLKEFFAFPMFATSLWLIWVYSFQTDLDAVVSLLIVLLIISLFFWLAFKFKNILIRAILFLMVIFIIIIHSITINSYDTNGSIKNSSLVSDNINWYSDIENIYQEEDQAYFINYTAAWCITCQANDKIALSKPKIKQYFKENNIKYVVADWTNKDREILKSLEKYQRNGVPLYIYWKPSMQKPLILPSILTEQLLLDNL
tara:strand:+ start:1742 stop:3709 length:1968 start_codon:yes stop_codon:yes gene_type:complete